MLAALLAAIGMYLLTDTVGQALVENIYMSESAQNQRNLATVSSFQTYAPPAISKRRGRKSKTPTATP